MSDEVQLRPKIPPTPEDHIQTLFHQIIKQYFPTHISDGWILRTIDSEEDWNGILEINYPNEDKSKINAFCYKAHSLIYIPIFKNLPELIIQSTIIHELCHMMVTDGGHGKAWVQAMYRCKSKADPLMAALLDLHILKMTVRAMLPIISKSVLEIKSIKKQPKELDKFVQEYQQAFYVERPKKKIINKYRNKYFLSKGR